MAQEFERVGPHLYRSRYQMGSGEWSIRFYGRFVDWKGKRRLFPLGSDLKTARDELKVLEARNIRKENFDAVEREGLTLSAWADDYFKNKIDPEKSAGGLDKEKRSFAKLKPFFGDMLLSEITKSKMMEYKAKRLQEPVTIKGKVVMRDGEPMKIQFPTVNRELALLRRLLNLAADDGILETCPRFKGLIKSEKGRERDRIITPEEFASILEHTKRPVQRVLICLYETGMRKEEAVKLTWDRVDEKARFIRLKSKDTKSRKPRSVPISDDLRAVLRELREEQKKVPNTLNRVFTRKGRPIKSIRGAWEWATENADVKNAVPHDLRHTCSTRWRLAGIPDAAVNAAIGHDSPQMAKRYTNVKESHLREAFAGKMAIQWQYEKPVDSAEAASY